jgi:diaminopimelate decarboxylase
LPLADLARQFGTPLYVYSARALRENYRRLAAAFAPLNPVVCYAVKANFNLSLLKILKAEGAGFDIVSGGELYRALKVGADPARIVFAGVGKTEAELSAALEANIGWFNVESADELARLNQLASARARRARIAFRLNPDVEPDTHQHIRTGGAQSKFGLPLDEARALAGRIGEYAALALRGAHIHIGSQMADPGPALRALDIALEFVREFPTIDTLDLGGGFPIRYRESDAHPPIEAFAAPIVEKLRPHVGRLSFHVEPGRYLIADTGALVATVLAVKWMAARSAQRTVVVDTGMHHLLRPALYGAYHRVLPLVESPADESPCSVVGPICESADVLAHDRQLPPLQVGDQLALMDAGAYGFAMASHYNSQPLPAEVLVDGGDVRLIRRRETWDDLAASEEA